jgi:hypothetical protein
LTDNNTNPQLRTATGVRFPEAEPSVVSVDPSALLVHPRRPMLDLNISINRCSRAHKMEQAARE